MRIIKLEVPVFTTGKKNKVPFTSVQQIYKNGRPVDNWISRDGIHNGQEPLLNIMVILVEIWNLTVRMDLHSQMIQLPMFILWMKMLLESTISMSK